MPEVLAYYFGPGAAELLAFLKDAIATRRPPVMELSLDLIQKLISFKLLQGPVYSINHRCAARVVQLSGVLMCT